MSSYIVLHEERPSHRVSNSTFNMILRFITSASEKDEVLVSILKANPIADAIGSLNLTNLTSEERLHLKESLGELERLLVDDPTFCIKPGFTPVLLSELRGLREALAPGQSQATTPDN